MSCALRWLQGPTEVQFFLFLHQFSITQPIMLLILLALVLPGLPACARTEPVEGFAVRLERCFPQLQFKRPVFLTGAGDGTDRIFVVEQHGRIHVFANEDDPEKTTIFLDISDEVSRKGNEEGLIGLAFHPDYAQNGFFYVHYSSSVQDEVGIVARYKVSDGDPNVADRESRMVVLEQPQPWRNHNGGMLGFGPDGFLYVSFGDGGSGGDPKGNGQNLSTWLGAILRIDVDRKESGRAYAIPKDNPFVDMKDAAPEIWAFGLRNVWRFGFDRANGDLWAGDVGQHKWEEVDIIERGGNYGWKRFEGDASFNKRTKLSHGRHIAPVAVYPRKDGISITGGYVYRGKRFPSLVGSYLYADYVTGNIWRIDRNNQGGYDNRLASRSGRTIASFGEDDNGEVFSMAFDGALYRIVPSNDPADAVMKWPSKLSQTGYYLKGKERQPSPNLIPYSVRAPFWSDGADKLRYFHLPEGSQLTWTEEGAWEIPTGAALIKTFEIGGLQSEKTLETRVIKRTETGWEAAAYVWRGKDAVLAPQGRDVKWLTKDGRATWHVPSSSACFTCHVDAGGFALGMNTQQLQGMDDSNGVDQVAAWITQGLLKAPSDFDSRVVTTLVNPLDEGASLNDRARSWLEVNCAMCHQPDGPGNAVIDLRLSTPLAQMRILGEEPSQGDAGIPGGKIVTPLSPEKSILLTRIKALDETRMPNVGSHVVDQQGVDLITAWIKSLKPN